MPDLKKTLGYTYLQETKFDRKNLLTSPRPRIDPVPLYKAYQKSNRISLPEFELRGDLQDILRARRSRRKFSSEYISLKEISALLWATQGKTGQTAGRALRTSPSAGALYPLETYLQIKTVEYLEPGLYHLNVPDFVLEELVLGDWSNYLAQACLSQRFVEKAGVNICFAAVLRRNMSKYGARGMRYIFMDVGHAAQNLFLAAEALNLSACPVGALMDNEINSMFGLDGDEESIIYCLSLGKKG